MRFSFTMEERGYARKIRMPIAKNASGEEIPIHQAERGRRGYFCTGCSKEVEAVKPRQEKPRPYFRHAAKDVDVSKTDCTWGNESYRHKIAKEVLQRLKYIRVPRVTKFPPVGSFGEARIVAPPRTIHAYRVDIQKSIYLDSEGKLKCGPKEVAQLPDSSKKYFLIVPDVIFFDKSDRPILFIELVASHDIDDEKMAKIRALKIDTVSVSLPIESPEAIEKCFDLTTRTKWIYNNEHERADYALLPRSDVQRVPGSSEDEGRLSYESTRCRKSRLGNLIRGIRGSMESDEYRKTEIGIRSQIKSIDEELSKRNRTREGIRERVQIDFERREGEVKGAQRRIIKLLEEVKQRYERKRKALEDEEASIEQLIKGHGEQSRNRGRDFIRAEEELRKEIESANGAIGSAGARIAEVRGKMETLQGDFEREGGKIEKFYEEERIRIERQFERAKGKEDSDLEQITGEEAEVPRRTESARAGIVQRFKGLREEANSSFERGNINGDTRLSGKVKSLVFGGEQLSDYTATLSAYNRYGRALKFIGTAAFSEWIKTRRGT